MQPRSNELPRHHADETREDMQARQRQAYGTGKEAWKEGRITGQVLQLYEELVRRVGGNPYCWIGEEALATDLNRSVSTIKRWMRQLVEAGLIRRERQFGHTTHTYIVAYDDYCMTEKAAVAATNSTARKPRTLKQQPASSCRQSIPEISSAHIHEGTTQTQIASAEKSEQPVERKDELSISSDSSRDSIKNQHLKLLGGGSGSESDHRRETTSSIRLQEEGVCDSDVVGELQECPIEDVEAVIRYVARCRTSDDPRRPGLIVHLLRRGFGAHHHLYAPSTQERAAGASADVPRSVHYRKVVAEWEEARTLLARQMAHEEYQTWIAHCELLLRDGDQVVLGVPNVFVRDEIEQRYQQQIGAALQTVYGQPVTIQVAIGVE